MPLGKWILLHAVLQGQCPSQLSCDISIFNMWSPRSPQKEEMRVDTLAGRFYGSCQEVQCVTSAHFLLVRTESYGPTHLQQGVGKWVFLCAQEEDEMVSLNTRHKWGWSFYLLAPVKISTLNTSASLLKSLVRDSGGINNIIHDVGL